MDYTFANSNYEKTLIVIDYQYDFVAKDGILTVGEPAQNLEDSLYNLVNQYLENKHLVIFTLDEHNAELWNKHPESKSFNIHCQKNEKGSRLYGKLESFMEDNRVYIIKKNAYSVNNLAVEKIINFSKEILLTGVVTDICVLQQAISLYNYSANSYIPINFYVKEDCCASFNHQAHNYALDYMKNILGFKII